MPDDHECSILAYSATMDRITSRVLLITPSLCWYSWFMDVMNESTLNSIADS